jgi:hypothetical protein
MGNANSAGATAEALERLELWRAAEREKARRLQIRAIWSGLLGLALTAVGAFFWPVWVAGVVALCIGFYQWKQSVLCRVGANVRFKSEDFES